MKPELLIPFLAKHKVRITVEAASFLADSIMVTVDAVRDPAFARKDPSAPAGNWKEFRQPVRTLPHVSEAIQLGLYALLSAFYPRPEQAAGEDFDAFMRRALGHEDDILAKLIGLPAPAPENANAGSGLNATEP